MSVNVDKNNLTFSYRMYFKRLQIQQIQPKIQRKQVTYSPYNLKTIFKRPHSSAITSNNLRVQA